MIKPETLFALIGDRTRLRSLALLRSEGRLCVCELVHALDVSQPKISRHLARLRAHGLVTDERRGQWVHYRLADGLPGWIEAVIAAGAEAIEEADSPAGSDQQRLAAMSHRPQLDAR